MLRQQSATDKTASALVALERVFVRVDSSMCDQLPVLTKPAIALGTCEGFGVTVDHHVPMQMHFKPEFGITLFTFVQLFRPTVNRFVATQTIGTLKSGSAYVTTDLLFCKT